MSDDLSELVAQIKTEFDLGGYFGDYAHIEKATALLDGLAERVRRGDAVEAATRGAIALAITADAKADPAILGPYPARYGGNLMNRFTNEPMTTMENRIYVDGVVRGKLRAAVVARWYRSATS